MKYIISSILILFLNVSIYSQKTINANDLLRDIKAGKNINISNSIIEGTLDLTYMNEALPNLPKRKRWWNNGGSNTIEKHINSKISFINCSFENDVLAYIPDEDSGYTFIASFKSDVIFKNCNFKGKAMFKFSKFKEDADFRGCKFVEDNTFKYAHFNKNVSFENTNFAEPATFKYAKFTTFVSFSNSIFQENATFKYSEFNNGVSFSNVRFEEDLNIKYTKVNGDFNINNMTVNYDIDSKYTIINGRTFNKYYKK